MKYYLTTSLALVCTVLVILLIVMKHGDDAQQESDINSITDYSNRLESVQMQVAGCEGSLINLSNSLDVIQTSSSAFSNHLNDAQSTIALQSDQITNLNRQVAGSASENQTLNQNIMDLTNQMVALSSRIALAEASLAKTNQDLVLSHKEYALLENRLHIDVAERLVVERKFNNLLELQAQLKKSKENPAGEITAESIYAGLDVEVKSNSFHVIAPN